MTLVDVLRVWTWRLPGRRNIWDGGNTPFIFAWYERHCHRLVPILRNSGHSPKGHETLRRWTHGTQGCPPTRQPVPPLPPTPLLPRSVASRGQAHLPPNPSQLLPAPWLPGTRPCRPPTSASDAEQQWVLLTGESSGEETGGRPPLKTHLPTASEISSHKK